MKRNSKNKNFEDIFFIILFLLYSGLTMILFYRQAMSADTDMRIYILEAQGLKSGYYPYRLFFWTARIWMLLFNPALSMALTTMLYNSAAVLLIKYYYDKEIKKYLEKENLQNSIVWDIFSTVAVFSLFFVSMVYSPQGTAFFGFDYTYKCAGIYTPNPYWNATSLAVRPFMIAIFFVGVDLLEEFWTVLSRKKVVIFGILVFLCTFTKPSFTFILVPTGGLILFWRFCRSKGRYWKNILILCASLIPTGALLLYEFSDIFAGDRMATEERGVGIELFKAWHLYSNNIPLSVVMGMLFPITVLILNAKQLKRSGSFRLAWQLWLAGFLTFAIFYEKGSRFTHMNFSWGYMHGLFIAFMVSILEMIKNVIKTVKGKSRLELLRIVPEIGFWGFHLICGIIFFIDANFGP